MRIGMTATETAIYLGIKIGLPPSWALPGNYNCWLSRPRMITPGRTNVEAARAAAAIGIGRQPRRTR
jgi:hypothetical protein